MMVNKRYADNVVLTIKPPASSFVEKLSRPSSNPHSMHVVATIGLTNNDDTNITSRKKRQHDKLKPIKTPSKSFADDLFQPGSIPHGACVGAVIGVSCGFAAYIYHTALEWLVKTAWKTVPDYLLGSNSYFPAVLWIPIVGFILATCVGLVVMHVGEPGDLAYAVKCVHESGIVDVDHASPMVLASLLSIAAGASVGPEAPLVAICASLAGFLSQNFFGTATADRNLLRKHTLMGMAGANAAFFECPIGGSIFALEITSRFGIEYFEHVVEAVFSGAICMAVFRTLAGLSIRAIWTITADHLSSAEPAQILYGGMLGLIGAGFAWLYAQFHKQVMSIFHRYHLLDKENAVYRAWAGTVVVATVGMLIPHTLFWGQSEFQNIATIKQANTLPHIWPSASAGLLHYEMHSFGTTLAVGLAKLMAISFSIAGGYRGGYIFPLFASGAALGRAIYFLLTITGVEVPVQVCVLCLAAALNVAVTRTVLSTPIILAYLSGEPNAILAILAASLASLFATAYMPFIASQVPRMDLEKSLYIGNDAAVVENNPYYDDRGCDESEETEALTALSDLHHQIAHDDGNDDCNVDCVSTV